MFKELSHRDIGHIVQVDCSSFLSAAEQHCQRGKCRVQALNYLHSLLTSDYSGLAVKQLLASVGAVLQHGPGVKDVACGGMADKVRESFAMVMHDVVELASKQPVVCIDTITLLSIIPYTRYPNNSYTYRNISNRVRPATLCVCVYVCQ